MFLNKDKLKSRKLWLTIWCMAIVTFIVVTNKTDFTQLATILSAAPLVYCGVNVYDKTHNNNGEEK